MTECTKLYGPGSILTILESLALLQENVLVMLPWLGMFVDYLFFWAYVPASGGAPAFTSHQSRIQTLVIQPNTFHADIPKYFLKILHKCDVFQFCSISNSMVLPIKLKHKKATKTLQQMFSWNKIFREKNINKGLVWPISQMALYK